MDLIEGKQSYSDGYALSRHAKYDATFQGGFVNSHMHMIDEISESGVVDATLATEAKGKKIVDIFVRR